MRRVVGEQIRAAAAAERFDALEMVRPHRENEVGALHQLARERLCPVRAEVHVPLHPDEQGAVAGRRTCLRARAGADRFDVEQAALDGDLPRDRFGHWAATRIAGADEENLHALTLLRSDWARSREASPPRSPRAE